VHQPEVHDDGVHGHAVPLHRHVQQAALLEAVVADVVVAHVAQRPARQQRVAMLAMARDGIAAVGHLVARRRQEVGLALVGPAEGRAVEARASRVWNRCTSCRNTRSASSASTARPRLWISSRLRGPTPRTPLWML
jgi:hypothetical protein